jgi:DNA-binding transcriptional LysR family regulator
LLDEPVMLALSPAEAARRDIQPGTRVRLADFADMDWLLPGPETSCHEMIRRACGAAGFVPRAVVLANDFSVLTALVSADAGVALVPRMAMPDGRLDLSIHELQDSVSRSISVVTRGGEARRPSLRWVIEALHSVSVAYLSDIGTQRLTA